MWIISVIPVLILLLLPLEIPWFIVKIIVLSVFLKTTFSIKMLYNLVKKSIPVTQETRKYAQQLVRRNVYELDEPHVISAAIESLFESLVDGIISPLFGFSYWVIPGLYYKG
jgi:adenosylcobinamide-phosphate synthase